MYSQWLSLKNKNHCAEFITKYRYDLQNVSFLLKRSDLRGTSGAFAQSPGYLCYLGTVKVYLFNALFTIEGSLLKMGLGVKIDTNFV